MKKTYRDDNYGGKTTETPASNNRVEFYSAFK